MAKIRQAVIVIAIAGAAFIAGRAGVGTAPSAFGAPPQGKKESPKKPATSQRQQAMMALASAGEAHKALEPLVGDWDGEVKVWFAPGRSPMTFKESVKRESIFGGRFVVEHVEATSATGLYQAMGILGYNNAAKRYETFFIDNGGTGMNLWTGTFDAGTTMFTFSGNEVDMNGKKVAFRTTIDCSSKDKQIKEGFKSGKGGKAYKAFEVTLRRKKWSGRWRRAFEFLWAPGVILRRACFVLKAEPGSRITHQADSCGAGRGMPARLMGRPRASPSRKLRTADST